MADDDGLNKLFVRLSWEIIAEQIEVSLSNVLEANLLSPVLRYSKFAKHLQMIFLIILLFEFLKNEDRRKGRFVKYSGFADANPEANSRFSS